MTDLIINEYDVFELEEELASDEMELDFDASSFAYEEIEHVIFDANLTDEEIETGEVETQFESVDERLNRSIEDTSDSEILKMEAAHRIALRKGIPIVRGIFDNPDKCEAFLDQALAEEPPPTFGMLKAAEQLMKGERVGLALSTMTECFELISKKYQDEFGGYEDER